MYSFKGTLGLSPSDCATILGENPYRSPRELYFKKLGIRTARKTKTTRPETPSAVRGKRLEPLIRQLYEKRTKLLWPESEGNCPFNPLGFLRCRLDGYCEELDAILECKAGNIEEHREALRGTLPRRYFIQVQAALFITATEECHYVSYCPNEEGVEELAIVVVKPDPKFVLHTLLPALLDFWEALSTRNEPK